MSVFRRQDYGEGWRTVKFQIFGEYATKNTFAQQVLTSFLTDSPNSAGNTQARIAAAAAAVQNNDFCNVVAITIVRNNAHVLEELERVTSPADGPAGEGVMLREPKSGYKNGRVGDSLKVKKKKDDEAKIVGHQGGEGKHEGRLGAYACTMRNGKKFKVRTGLKDVERDNPIPIGRYIKFSYFELTNAGVPRFPAFEYEVEMESWP